MKNAGLIKGSILLGFLLFSGSIKTAVDLREVNFEGLAKEGQMLAKELFVKNKLDLEKVKKALLNLRNRLLGLNLDIVVKLDLPNFSVLQKRIEKVVPGVIAPLEKVMPFAAKPASAAGLVNMVILPNEEIMKLFKPRFAEVLRNFVSIIMDNSDLINSKVGPGLVRFLNVLLDGLRRVDEAKGYSPENYKRVLIDALGMPVVESAVKEVMDRGLRQLIINNKNDIEALLKRLKEIGLRQINFPKIAEKIEEIVGSRVLAEKCGLKRKTRRFSRFFL